MLPSDGYYNTRMLADWLRPHGAVPVPADLLDLAQVEWHLGAGPAVLWAETPTNPLLRVADLGELARLAAAAGAPMIVDNTVATGLLQKPLELGAVASLCSLTKAASGHSDVLLGAVMTRDPELLNDLRGWRSVGGGIPGPFESWLALRGLKTLALRVARQSESALAIARRLAAHPRVRAVHYPGTGAATLEVARRQMPRGFGPLLSFEVDGTAADTDAVITASRIILPATSFGGVESAWERRARWASETAPESLIRLSVGIERRTTSWPTSTRASPPRAEGSGCSGREEDVVGDRAEEHPAGQLADPPHAVDGDLRVVTKLLSHPGGAAAGAELPHGLADRLSHRVTGRGIRWLKPGCEQRRLLHVVQVHPGHDILPGWRRPGGRMREPCVHAISLAWRGTA